MAHIVMAYGVSPYTTATYLRSAFEALGHRVTVMDLDALWQARGRKVRRVIFREARTTRWVNAARWLRVRRLNPDLFLWVESPREVELRVPKLFPCPTASWVIDTNVEHDRLLPLSRQFEHPFVSQKGGTDSFRAAGLDAIWLPLAADPAIHRPLDLPVEFDIGFVGNVSSPRYKERQRVLRALAQRYRTNLVRAYGEQMVREYARCTLGFNMGLSGGLNMRVFEVMAIGRCLVSDLGASGILDVFQDGKHFFGYGEEAEIYTQVDAALADPEKACQTAKAAREEVLAHHTYKHRAQTIVKECLG